MSDDIKTNQFVRDCVTFAAQWNANGNYNAASALLQVAAVAIKSPQETAPLQYYRIKVAEALYAAFGYPHEMADLSRSKQVEAIAAWGWFSEVFAIEGHVDDTIDAAIRVMRSGGYGWKDLLFAILSERAEHQRNMKLAEKALAECA